MNPQLEAELTTQAAKLAHELWPTVNHQVRSDERVRDETLIALGIEAGFTLAMATAIETVKKGLERD